jgi:hypothetical protein
VKRILGGGGIVSEDGRQITDDKGYCIVLPEAAEVGEKINQKRRGVRAKIHFFKIFLSLSI